MIKIEDIDPTLLNEELDIHTCIVNNTFEWKFALKDHVQSEKEILLKLKLVKNLTSGDDDENPSKVTWRFKLSPG